MKQTERVKCVSLPSQPFNSGSLLKISGTLREVQKCAFLGSTPGDSEVASTVLMKV